MSAPFDRPCAGGDAGGCSCDWCGVVFIGAEVHDGCCAVCLAAEPWKLLPAFDPVAARERLAAVIAAQDAERGRPLTDQEKLENLFRSLNESEDLPLSPPRWKGNSTMSEAVMALALRCEQAISADRELDARIWCAVSPPPESYTIDSWHRGDPRPAGADVIGLTLADWLSRWPDDAAKMADSYGVPKYTASLDAATSLVPENHIHAIFYPEGRIKVQMWDRTRGDYCGFGVDVPEATAATYPIALTSACLRARALTDPRP